MRRIAQRCIFWVAVIGTAPVVLVALVSLGVEVYSIAVMPVSLSFRFFAQGGSTDLLRLPSAGVSVALLVAIGALLWALRRACFGRGTD